MVLSNSTKILLISAVCVVALYVFMSNSNKEPMSNEGVVSYDPNDHELAVNDESNVSQSNSTESEESIDEDNLSRKMRSRNSSRDGYKKSSYNAGGRSDSSELDKFFEEGAIDGGDNDSFLPSDATDGKFASYASGQKRPQSDEDKFNSAELLPKDTNKDWFEDVHAVSVKNRHLINIYRPIGVNTTSTTNKNQSRDLRGEEANPKTFVGPFLNSSYDPNIYSGGLCGKRR